MSLMSSLQRRTVTANAGRQKILSRYSLWRLSLTALLCALCTAILIASVHAYTTRPVFLLFTALTIAATLLSGSAVGLASLFVSIIAVRFFVGPFADAAQQRLIANLCVDFTFVALITYLRSVGSGRERAVAELRLKDAALTSAANAVVITDRAGAILWVNPAFTELSGYTLEEVKGQNPRLLKSGEHGPQVYAALWQTITSGKSWRGEMVNRRKDGSTYVEEMTITPVRAAATGEITNFIAIKVDVTERRAAEKALLRNERLAATGRLAATIAHEIRNPLAVMTDLLHLIRPSVTDASARVYLDLITSQVQAVNRIASQTLDFHRDNAEPVVFSVSELATDIVHFYQAKAKQQRIVLDARLDGSVSIFGYIGEIRQVISNLLLNAMEATAAGGKVIVHVREGKLRRDGELHGCRITIADSGSGIDRACRDRIFEPFFTTKGEKGTGLGLWVSVGAVERAGGSIRVRSTRRTGRSGTCFSIFLPPNNAAVASGPHPITTSSSILGTWSSKSNWNRSAPASRVS
jgi:PAS domain S-box-containing protein